MVWWLTTCAKRSHRHHGKQQLATSKAARSIMYWKMKEVSDTAHYSHISGFRGEYDAVRKRYHHHVLRLPASLSHLCWAQPALQHVSYFCGIVITWKRKFKSCPPHTLYFNCTTNFDEAQKQGANYQRVSLILLCSFMLFMSTEAYRRSVSEPVTLSPDNRNQQIQNIFRAAHSLSLYHHFKPFLRCHPLKVLSVSFWVNAALPIRQKSRWGCTIHATSHCKFKENGNVNSASAPVYFFCTFIKRHLVEPHQSSLLMPADKTHWGDRVQKCSPKYLLSVIVGGNVLSFPSSLVRASSWTWYQACPIGMTYLDKQSVV